MTWVNWAVKAPWPDWADYRLDKPKPSPRGYSVDESDLHEVLITMLQFTPDWDRRYEIAWYVSLCMSKGFCKTTDQMKACAERYLAGKRKVTPPGTRRRVRDEKRRKEALANVPAELTAAAQAVIAENPKAITQYKAGTEKALNALVGGVMKRYKADPAVIKQLLIEAVA